MLPPWQIADEFLDEAFADDGGEDEDEEPLEPWLDPPAGFIDPEDDTALERLQRTAAAAVAAFDAELAAFVARPEIADALLIVTAGRGQALGEHGLIGEGRPWLHEELVHLPLIVRFPDGAQAGRRVLDLTQSVDVPATLLEWLGEPIPEDWHGRSLLGLARGGPAVRAYAVTGWKVGDAEEWALRLPEASLIVPKAVPPGDPPRGPMLFVKPDDRWEVNDLRREYLDWAEELEATLAAYAEAAAQSGPLVPPPLPADDEDSGGDAG